MKKRIQRVFLMALVLLMSGCSYYAFRNPDGTLPDAQSYYLCNNEALELFPSYYVDEYYSSYKKPTKTICSKDGECIEEEGAWVDGYHYEVDKNKDERDDLFVSCMLANGYVFTKIKKEYNLKKLFLH